MIYSYINAIFQQISIIDEPGNQMNQLSSCFMLWQIHLASLPSDRFLSVLVCDGQSQPFIYLIQGWFYTMTNREAPVVQTSTVSPHFSLIWLVAGQSNCNQVWRSFTAHEPQIKLADWQCWLNMNQDSVAALCISHFSVFKKYILVHVKASTKKGSHWCISQKKKKKDINIPTNCWGLSMGKKPVMLAVCGWAKIWCEACWLVQQSKQREGRLRWMWYAWLRESETPRRAGMSRQPSLLHLQANLTFCKTNRGWERSLHVRLSCLIS